MGPEIRGDADGLRAMAAMCQRQAAALNTEFAAPTQGPAFQATSRAVVGVHAKAHVVERAIVIRIDATAAKADAAARNY